MSLLSEWIHLDILRREMTAVRHLVRSRGVEQNERRAELKESRGGHFTDPGLQNLLQSETLRQALSEPAVEK